MDYFSPPPSIIQPSAAGSLSQLCAPLSLSGARRMDKWVRLSTGDARGARGLPAGLPCLGPLDPLSPLGALVNFIYTTLRIHTFASGGIASCTAHTHTHTIPPRSNHWFRWEKYCFNKVKTTRHIRGRILFFFYIMSFIAESVSIHKDLGCVSTSCRRNPVEIKLCTT